MQLSQLMPGNGLVTLYAWVSADSVVTKFSKPAITIPWALIHQADGRLTVGSRETFKPPDWML